MKQTFDNPYPPAWRNYHYDGRQYWLANPWPEPDRRTLFMRFQTMLAHLSGRIASPAPKPDRDRDN